MFKGSNGNGSNKVADINSPDRLNRIVEGTTIQGEIKSDSNIRIDGKVDGNIITKGRVVVGPKGTIDGSVTCQFADVEGQINGSIQVNELLSLKSTANIDGDIETAKLSIEPGANFTGQCIMKTEGMVKPLNTKKVNKRNIEKVSETNLANGVG